MSTDGCRQVNHNLYRVSQKTRKFSDYFEIVFFYLRHFVIKPQIDLHLVTIYSFFHFLVPWNFLLFFFLKSLTKSLKMQYRNRNRHVSLTSFGNLAAYDLSFLTFYWISRSPSSPMQFWTFYWISRVPFQSYPVLNILMDIPGPPPVLSSFEHSIEYPGSPSSPVQFLTFYWISRVPLQYYPVLKILLDIPAPPPVLSSFFSQLVTYYMI